MPTKVKGLLKGFKYISNIFEDQEKEEEIQIGMPTDVKHVAHIGCEGHVDNPSWMKDFKSAPLGPPEEQQEDRQVVWVSDDAKRIAPKAASSSATITSRELPNLPKPNSQSQADDPNSSKPSRRPRRRQPKVDKDDTSANQETSNSSSVLPNIPKKTRRRRRNDKSKESELTGGSSRSTASSEVADSDAGSEVGSVYSRSTL